MDNCVEVEYRDETFDVYDRFDDNNPGCMTFINCTIGTFECGDDLGKLYLINTTIEKFNGSIRSYIDGWPGVDIPGCMRIIGDLNVPDNVVLQHDGDIGPGYKYPKQLPNSKWIKIESMYVTVKHPVIENNILVGSLVGYNTIIDIREKVHFIEYNNKEGDPVDGETFPIFNSWHTNILNENKPLHPDQKGFVSFEEDNTMQVISGETIDNVLKAGDKYDIILRDCEGDTLKLKHYDSITLINCRFNRIRFNKVEYLHVSNCKRLDGDKPISVYGKILTELNSDVILKFKSRFKVPAYIYPILDKRRISNIAYHIEVHDDADLSKFDIVILNIKNDKKDIHVKANPTNVITHTNYDAGCVMVHPVGKEFNSNKRYKLIDSKSEIINCTGEKVYLTKPQYAYVFNSDKVKILGSIEELHLLNIKKLILKMPGFKLKAINVRSSNIFYDGCYSFNIDCDHIEASGYIPVALPKKQILNGKDISEYLDELMVFRNRYKSPVK